MARLILSTIYPHIRFALYIYFASFTLAIAQDTHTDQIVCDDLCQTITHRTIISNHKSGTYIGISAGASLLNNNTGNGGISINNDIASPNDEIIPIPSFGLRTGAVSFFNQYMGVRGVFGFDMGFGKHSGILTMLSVGIDAIAEFPISKHLYIFLGGILGIGADAYLYYDKQDYNRWSKMKKAGEIFMQVGITTTLGKRSRVNLIYRFLPARKASHFSPTGVVSLEYNFKF